MDKASKPLDKNDLAALKEAIGKVGPAKLKFAKKASSYYTR